MISFLDSIPTLVAIHRIVAPANRGDSNVGQTFELLVESENKLFSAVRWRIPAVQKQMQKNFIEFLAPRHLDQRFHMALVAVHTAVAQKPHQMEPIAVCFGFA